MPTKAFLFNFSTASVNAGAVDLHKSSGLGAIKAAQRSQRGYVALDDGIDAAITKWINDTPGVRVLNISQSCTSFNNELILSIILLYEKAPK